MSLLRIKQEPEDSDDATERESETPALPPIWPPTSNTTVDPATPPMGNCGDLGMNVDPMELFRVKDEYIDSERAPLADAQVPENNPLGAHHEDTLIVQERCYSSGPITQPPKSPEIQDHDRSGKSVSDSLPNDPCPIKKVKIEEEDNDEDMINEIRAQALDRNKELGQTPVNEYLEFMRHLNCDHYEWTGNLRAPSADPNLYHVQSLVKEHLAVPVEQQQNRDQQEWMEMPRAPCEYPTLDQVNRTPLPLRDRDRESMAPLRPDHPPHLTSQRRPSKTADRKSILCSYFRNGNNCRFGENCKYGHDARLSARPPERCRAYANDKCKLANRCRYLHGEFPCRAFHTAGVGCPRRKCKFSHEPLTDYTRCLLAADSITRAALEEKRNRRRRTRSFGGGEVGVHVSNVPVERPAKRTRLSSLPSIADAIPPPGLIAVPMALVTPPSWTPDHYHPPKITGITANSQSHRHYLQDVATVMPPVVQERPWYVQAVGPPPAPALTTCQSRQVERRDQHPIFFPRNVPPWQKTMHASDRGTMSTTRTQPPSPLSGYPGITGRLQAAARPGTSQW